MDQKFCKKCGKPLPSEYKYYRCERCRNKNAETGKTIGGVVVGVLGTIVVIVKAIASSKKG